MATYLKPWHKVQTALVPGLRKALLMPETRDVAVQFCREMADRQGVETVHHSPAKWLENARKNARKISLRAYQNAYAMQHWHWKKLVYEMRQIEDMQP